jgi:protein-L-isoaspartate(D-aspartate) O-methyltransferase
VRKSDGAELRRALVRELERAGVLSRGAVRDAFLAVPRERFLRDFAAREGLAAVYRDEAILTRRDPRGAPASSSSQPAIMAMMLERLALERGARVLEIGTGTGYNAALLATIVGPGGRVVSVELDPETVAKAQHALQEGGYAVEVVAGDGREGFAPEAPYDRVIVTASAETVPRSWYDQLVDGGIVVVPLRVSAATMQAIPALRKEAGGFRSVAVLCGSFMPLRGAPDEPIDEPGGIDLPDGLELSHVAGSGLDAEAGRRLEKLVTGAPRVRLVDLRATRWALGLYLALEAPPGRFVDGPAGAGVIAPNGGGIALVTGSRRHAVLAAWGDPEAEALLGELLAGWRELGEPAEAQLDELLELRISYPGGVPTLSHRWRRAAA